MPRIAGLGDCFEIPQFRPIAGIVHARIPGRTFRTLAIVVSQDHQVLINVGSAAPVKTDLDRTFFSETGIDNAGVGIQRHHVLSSREQNTRRIGGVARPVTDAAVSDRSGSVVGPDFLTRIGFECDHARARRDIHHSIDHDGRDFTADASTASFTLALAAAPFSVVGRWRRGGRPIRPGLRELSNVSGVDLGQRRKLVTHEVAAVKRPVAGRDAGLFDRGLSRLFTLTLLRGTDLSQQRGQKNYTGDWEHLRRPHEPS